MANELSIYLATGQTVKGLYFGSNRTTIWNGSAFVAVSTVAAANYAAGQVSFTEQATSDAAGTGMYVASRPAGITALGEAEYHVVVFANPITPGKAELGIIQDVVYNATDPYAVLNTIAADVVNVDGAAIPTAAAVASAVWLLAGAIDGKTPQEAMRYIAAILAGKVSGAGTGTETFVGLDGSTDRVAVTVDDDGNRSAMDYDPA